MHTLLYVGYDQFPEEVGCACQLFPDGCPGDHTCRCDQTKPYSRHEGNIHS